MRKYRPDAANLVTLLRIFGAVGILLTAPFGFGFFAVYTLCGATDVLDGVLARRFAHARGDGAKRRGAALDSAADLALVCAMAYVCGSELISHAWIVCAACGVAAVRLATAIVGYVKYRRFAWLHTYMNKAAGLALFLYAYVQAIAGVTAAAAVVAAVCAIAAAEELVITLRSDELDANVRGLFF